MEDNSKRDIYDLIAELAKSSNMNIDGTEFVPENVDVKRKAFIQENATAEKVPANQYNESDYSESIVSSASKNQEVDLIAEFNKMKAASIEELNILKSAALEELKNAKTGLIQELNSPTKSIENSPYTSDPIKEVASPIENYRTSRLEELQLMTLEEFRMAKEFALKELNSVQSSVHQELTRLKSIGIQEPKISPPTIHEPVPFESLSIDELNKITAKALKETSHVTEPSVIIEEINPIDIKHETVIGNVKIHDQLQLLHTKIDELSERNLKSEIVNELKLSDERIVQQVTKTRETLLHDFSTRLSDKQIPTTNSFIRWLAIFNLLLLVMVMMYLFFQKISESSATNRSEKKSVPSKQHELIPAQHKPSLDENKDSTQVSENSAQTSQATESEFQHEKKSSSSQSSAKLQTNDRAFSQQNPTTKSSPDVNQLPSEVSQDGRNSNSLLHNESAETAKSVNRKQTNSYKKNVGDSYAKGSLDIQQKNKIEVSKKTTPKQDVYFGED